MIGERPFAAILDLEEGHCPKDEETGCEWCSGEEECIQRAHDEGECLDGCPICARLGEDAQDHEDGKGDMQHQMMKDDQAESEIE